MSVDAEGFGGSKVEPPFRNLAIPLGTFATSPDDDEFSEGKDTIESGHSPSPTPQNSRPLGKVLKTTQASEEPENFGELHSPASQSSTSELLAAEFKSHFSTSPPKMLIRARVILHELCPALAPALAAFQVPFSNDPSDLVVFLLHWCVDVQALVAEIKAGQLIVVLMVFLHICVSLSGPYFTKDAVPGMPLPPTAEVFRVQLYDYRQPPVGW